MSDTQSTPERPPIADDITDEQLIARYLAGTALVRETIAGMDADQLHARPIEGKMSTQEVVTHIVDSDDGLGGRIRRAIAAEDIPLVQGPGGHPEPISDPTRDVEAELQHLAMTREQMAEEMRQLPADAWDLVAIRREDRVMTVRQVFTLLVRHLENHVVTIEAKKAALGL